MKSTSMGITRLPALLILTLLMLLIGTDLGSGARILMTSPQYQSLVIMQQVVAEELVRRGHDVYIGVGSRYPKLASFAALGLRTLTYRIPPDVLYLTSEEMEHYLADAVFNASGGGGDIMHMHKVVGTIVNRDCEYMLSDDEFIRRVGELHFDMAVVEPFVLSPCTLLLPHRHGIRFVSMTDFYNPWDIRIPALPSFLTLPGPWKRNPSPRTFGEALANLAVYVGGQLGYGVTVLDRTLLERYGNGIVSWNELLHESELFLIGNDFQFGLTLPLFPNVVPVPGVTTGPAKALTGEIAKIVANAVDGVVVVSFGSTAHYIPDAIVAKFFAAFAQLKQTVLAKFNAPKGVPVPANVRLLSWLPQNDLLGHPRTRLFVTHCGNKGQHEALYHGVPMLGFPLFAEQAWNCHRAALKGFGLEMDVNAFGVEELRDNINELVDNASYRDAIRKMSAIWKDEPIIGREKAAHWIEHVIKFGGSHLRSPAMDMPVYRFLSLDLLAAVVLVVVVVAAMFVAVLRLMIKLSMKRSASSSSKKQQ